VAQSRHKGNGQDRYRGRWSATWIGDVFPFFTRARCLILFPVHLWDILITNCYNYKAYLQRVLTNAGYNKCVRRHEVTECWLLQLRNGAIWIIRSIGYPLHYTPMFAHAQPRKMPNHELINSTVTSSFASGVGFEGHLYVVMSLASVTQTPWVGNTFWHLTCICSGNVTTLPQNRADLSPQRRWLVPRRSFTEQIK